MSLCSEEEAKERWCPYAMAAFPAESIRARPDLGEHMAEHLTHAVVGNRPDTNLCCCMASACMAWRWQPLQADQPFMDAVKARMDSSGENMSKATKFVRANLADLGLSDKPTRGWCGLAGKP